jgi:hypothetical protein
MKITKKYLQTMITEEIENHLSLVNKSVIDPSIRKAYAQMAKGGLRALKIIEAMQELWTSAHPDAEGGNPFGEDLTNIADQLKQIISAHKEQ